MSSSDEAAVDLFISNKCTEDLFEVHAMRCSDG